MDYTSAKEYLFSLKGKGAKYGIDRMRLFVEKLGQPQKRLRVIHVAGTNGKGSVSAMCESICRAAGLRTGLYTSPHLVRLGERVQVDREILSEEEIVRYTLELKKVAEEIGAKDPEDHPTFFEFMTAMAFLHFVRCEVDVAIIEVGLGGRLDATNVVDPQLCVITSIGLDHTQQLGSTLAEVAREKAGILKRGIPVVLGLMAPEAREAIETVAKERNSPVLAVADAYGSEIDRFPETRLNGEHQRANAATASLVFQALRDRLPISDANIQEGLQNVQWAGRWETREVAGKSLIFEAAHNPEGAEVLDKQLIAFSAAGNRAPIVVVGVLGEDRATSLLKVIAKHARAICICTPNQPRATPAERLRELIPASFSGNVETRAVTDVFSRENGCALGKSGDTILVTGSLYLIGEVLEQLEPRPVQEGFLQD